MQKAIWINQEGKQFLCKANAFDWLNKAEINIDMPKLFCDGDLRFTKTPFGIFDRYSQTYINGKLPVEYYA